MIDFFGDFESCEGGVCRCPDCRPSAPSGTSARYLTCTHTLGNTPTQLEIPHSDDIEHFTSMLSSGRRFKSHMCCFFFIFLP